MTRKLTVRFFRICCLVNMKFLEAENGMEASAILQSHEHEISVMLLDIVMPVMDRI